MTFPLEHRKNVAFCILNVYIYVKGKSEQTNLIKMRYIIYKTNEEVIIMRKELLKGLTEEQVKKVKACKSQEEILELAKTEGVELNEEQLAAVSGGMCHTDEKPAKCPECGSKDLEFSGDPFSPTGIYICKKCGNRFAREVPQAPWA